MSQPVLKLKLELEVQDTQTILNGLSELPYKISAELIHRIKVEGDKVFTSPIKK